MADTIKIPFGVQIRVGTRNYVSVKVHIGATWQIWSNDLRAAALGGCGHEVWRCGMFPNYFGQLPALATVMTMNNIQFAGTTKMSLPS